jgi:hypothetical protein
VSMPAMKLVGKTRMGSKEIKKYGEDKSPYQRLMDSPALESAIKERLKRTIALYNPVSLSSMMLIALLKPFWTRCYRTRKGTRCRFGYISI